MTKKDTRLNHKTQLRGPDGKFVAKNPLSAPRPRPKRAKKLVAKGEFLLKLLQIPDKL